MKLSALFVSMLLSLSTQAMASNWKKVVSCSNGTDQEWLVIDSG